MAGLFNFDVVKKRVYKNIDVLTEISTDANQIKKPIEQSNKRIKEVTDEISKLNTKNKLVKLVQLSVLEDQIPKIKSETDFYIEQLKNGCAEVEAICYDYNYTIEDIIRDLDLLPVNSKDREDILGVISINRLKLANLKTHVENAHNQIDVIEKFRTFTLHHLTDSIKSVKTDQKKSLLDEIKNQITKLSYRTKILLTTFLLLVIFTIYNFITYNYYITYSSTVKVAQKAVEKAVASGSVDSLNPLLESVSTYGFIIGFILIMFAGSQIVLGRGSSAIGFSVVGVSCASASIIAGADLDPNQISYIEQPVQISYYFYNVGAVGLIILSILVSLTFIFFCLNKNQLSQYKTALNNLNRIKRSQPKPVP